MSRTPAVRTTGAVCLAVILAASGCEQGSSDAGSAGGKTAGQPKAHLPADLFVAEAPDGATGVQAAKKAGQPRADVVVRGRIGGRKDPFAKGRAMFTLVDMDVPTCADKSNDHCPTPWDYCCEPKDNLLANALTVQVVGEDGRPLDTALDGIRGLKPMAEVVVAGKVASRDDAGGMVVSATGIFVDGG